MTQRLVTFFGAGCTAWGYFCQKLIFILMCDVEPSPVHILAHASPGLCSCQASVIASEAYNSSFNKYTNAALQVNIISGMLAASLRQTEHFITINMAWCSISIFWFSCYKASIEYHSFLFYHAVLYKINQTPVVYVYMIHSKKGEHDRKVETFYSFFIYNNFLNIARLCT